MIRDEELKKFEVFQDLTESELESIVQIAVNMDFKAGARIFAEKSLAANLFLVLQGEVSIKMGQDSYTSQLTTDIILPGQTFGWSALTDPFTFTAGAFAVTDTQLLAFDGKRLRKLFKLNNQLGYKIMMRIASVISKRIRQLREKLVDCAARSDTHE
jgi:CRP/FNR family transcriptional regulator, cyclic AMP receptor protein